MLQRNRSHKEDLLRCRLRLVSRKSLPRGRLAEEQAEMSRIYCNTLLCLGQWPSGPGYSTPRRSGFRWCVGRKYLQPHPSPQL